MKILTLNQTEYTERMLERFNVKKCKVQATPMITRQVKKREIKYLEENSLEE